MDSIVKYTVVTSGNKDWILDVAVPLSEGLETEGQKDGNLVFERNLPNLLNYDSQPKASSSFLIAGVVGIVVFLATRLGGKIVDDIYELKLQPIIRKSLAPADSKLKGSNSKKKNAAKQAHISTLKWMQGRDLNKKVLLSKVDANGSEESILIFDNMQSAQDHLHSLEALE